MISANNIYMSNRGMGNLLLATLLIVSLSLSGWANVILPIETTLPVSLSQTSTLADLPAGLDEQIAAARYQFTWEETSGLYVAPNLAQQFNVRIGSSALQVSGAGSSSWEWNLHLSAWGYADRLQPIGLPIESGLHPTAFDRFEFQYAGPTVDLTAWFQNAPSGLEHGFNVARPPSGSSTTGDLIFDMLYTGSFSPVLQHNDQVIQFVDAMGVVRLNYAQLLVLDASGRILPSRLALKPGPDADSSIISLQVNDHGAVYPLWVDPTLSVETAKITASDGLTDDQFGSAVAVSGDTAIIGAPGKYITATLSSNDRAYIYARNTGGADEWGEVADLSPTFTTDTHQFFGFSVTLDGDTAAVGAPRFDGASGQNYGAVYIFGRNQGGLNQWGVVAQVLAPDGGVGDQFGRTVALDGDTLVVGAPFHDGGGLMNAGAVYVYQRNQGGLNAWGFVTKLASADLAPGDRLGYRVEISGDLILAGSPYKPDLPEDDPLRHAGAAYVFERNQGGADQWGQVRKITNGVGISEEYFGWSLAIDGELAVIGAPSDGGMPGSAYVHARNQGGADLWGQLASLDRVDPATGDQFGWAVDVRGDEIVVGAFQDQVPPNVAQGSAYIFERHLGGLNAWSQIQKLTASDGTEGDNFGYSVALSGSALLIGAYRVDISTHIDQGATYAFYSSGSGWAEVASPLASDGAAGDDFGGSVVVVGETLVVGAPLDDGAAGVNQGALYIFSRSTGGLDNWGQVRKITAPDAAAGDEFGAAVGLSLDRIVAGAPGAAGAGGADQGSAYVFARNQGGLNNWGYVVEISATDGDASDAFGTAVDIESDWIAVGSPNNASSQGAVYIFGRNQGGADVWGQVQKLSESGSVGLGAAVSLSQEKLLAGAPETATTAGRAYLFARNQGGADVWGLVKTIQASDQASGDKFGSSVALYDGLAAVGAPYDDSARGAVYVSLQNQGGADQWGEVRRVVAVTRTVDGLFGASVDIDDDLLAVGAPGQNRVFTYKRNSGGADVWGAFTSLVDAASETGDMFGQALSLDHKFLVVGSPSAGPLNQGKAIVYQLSENFHDLVVSKTTPPVLLGPGDPVSFVIEFANQGNDPAEEIIISDELPAVISNASYTSSGVPVTLISPDFAWGVSQLLPGEGGTITVTGTISETAASGIYDNTVYVVGSGADINFANNSDTVQFEVDADPPAPPVLVSPTDGRVYSGVRNITSGMARQCQ
jgi:uncharacterized repeat protein (TIGR01451 family)